MIEGFPLEACGFLIGPVNQNDRPTGEIAKFYPTKNAAKSARIYEIDSIDQLKASRSAQDDDMEIVGVVHSHTHTHAYPSPTDINLSIDPNWLYAIVSLENEEIIMNGYQINKEAIEESEKIDSVELRITN